MDLSRIRHVPPAVRDAAVTTLVVAVTLVPAGARVPYTWWLLALALTASVPVFLRRRAPLTVAAVTGVATSALAMAGSPPLLPLGPLVCVYTFAALSPPLPRRIGLAGTAAGVTVSRLLPRPDLEVLRYLAVAYLAAYALGTSVRAGKAQVTVLHERSRRLEQERVSAVLRERTRIARDLHDGLAHAVGIMVVQAEAGPLTARSGPERADATFAAIADTGREALVQLRRVVGALRPSGDGEPLHRPGLEALPTLVGQVRTTGLDACLSTEGDPGDGAPDDVAVAAYRIVQEALTNTVRHAGARTVRVAVRHAGGRLAVEVTDDGRGPPAGAGGDGTGGGYGLIGMRERALACGGTLHVGAGPGGRGFRVHAVLPVAVP